MFSELNEYKNAYYTPIDYIDGGIPFARRKRRVFYGYQFQDFSVSFKKFEYYNNANDLIFNYNI